MTLPNEKFEKEMNRSNSKQFKDMQKKYCDAVSTDFLFSAFSLENEKIVCISF